MSDPRFENKFRIADAIRALNAEIVASDAPDDVFGEAIEKIDRFTRQLAGKPQRSRTVGPKKDADGNIIGFEYGPDMKHFSPVWGRANPLSPPFRGERVRVRGSGG